MNQQALAARRAYKRKWAKEHPEKIRAQQERYWNKIAAAATENAENESGNEPAGNSPLPAEG